MQGDPDGDQCGTKDVAPIYVEVQDDVDRPYIEETVRDALGSYNRKLDHWRNG